MIARVLIAAFTALLYLGIPSAAHATTDDFQILSMSVDYYLGRDDANNATLKTIEVITAEFPDFDQNHGLERAIPLKYGEANLELQIVSVTNEAGEPLTYSRSDSDGFAVLRIGDADRYVHGVHTYRITYKERNVIRNFADTNSDEFYWDVNGTGWPQSFETVEARIHLSDGLTSELTGELACYQGYQGETNSCSIHQSGDVIEARAEALSGYQTMTFAIGFSPDAFVDPPLLRNTFWFAVLPYLLMVLTGLAFLVVLGLRIFVWRDKKPEKAIIAQYEPPDNIYPMLAAQFLHRENTAIPAEILGLATDRIVRIREHKDRPKHRRYELELLAGWPTVKKIEEGALSSFFDNELQVGATQVLDPTSRDLGDRIHARLAIVSGEVAKNGWVYRLESRWPKILRWLTFVVALASIVLCIVMANNDLDLYRVWGSAFVCVVGWLVVAIMATPPLLLSRSGREIRDHLMGVKEYLTIAEADRIRLLQAPETAERIGAADEASIIKVYEKLLPYAVIFGIEKAWLSTLGTHYAITEQPTWYEGANSLANVTTFASVYRATSFATTPPPSSSGGSSWSSSGGSSFSGGSSGGGFSGGGGGGGGGGGW